MTRRLITDERLAELMLADDAIAQALVRKRAWVAAQRQHRPHTCHWPGCTKQVKPAMWGCAPHWYTLPKRIRDLIWRTYDIGQELRMDPSTAYLDAADAAQEWIAGYLERTGASKS